MGEIGSKRKQLTKEKKPTKKKQKEELFKR
jgi:hypothetical protein